MQITFEVIQSNIKIKKKFNFNKSNERHGCLMLYCFEYLIQEKNINLWILRDIPKIHFEQLLLFCQISNKPYMSTIQKSDQSGYIELHTPFR